MQRLFFALPFDEMVQKSLWSRSLQLRERLGGRAVRLGNYHLTLQFLGMCGAEQTAAAKQALTGLAAIEPLVLAFDRPGYFRQRQNALVWLGMQSESGLIRLVETLAALLAQAGFPRDNKPFWPHVTLLRDVPLPLAGEWADDWPEVPSVMVKNVVLFESVTGPTGLCYRPLATSR